MFCSFGTISVEDFLHDYWQQKPLLIRQGLPGFSSPITADELAGLACETEAARIVLEKGGTHPWEVRHGPFTEDSFATLPETHWTLLVNDTDRHLPELKAIIDYFRFIPDWRIDDLMISFAVEGGSVGPHVDEYDVFLIQAQGQRRWQITTQPDATDNFLPDIELRIMPDFHPEQEWVVNPGDVLYLPPHVPHYGLALNNCMTYSVGFRAPSQADLLGGLLEDVIQHNPGLQQRFSDRCRALQKNPAFLDATDLAKLTDFILQALPTDRRSIQEWIGRYLTQNKSEQSLASNYLPRKNIARKQTLLKKKPLLFKALVSRLAYSIFPDKALLFINGEQFEISKHCVPLLENVLISDHDEPIDYSGYSQDKACMELLQLLVSKGVLHR